MTDGVVFPFQIEPISLGFDLVSIKEPTPFRFRLAAKTALCWLLLPFPNRTRSAGLRFGCLRSSAAAGGVRSTDGVVFPFQIEPISLGFDLVPIKEQTQFRFRFTAKTALCWLLLPFPNRTHSVGLRFTFFTTRRASTICACPPSHILSVSHFYFLKNATTTAPGPAWVPITLPTVV